MKIRLVIVDDAQIVRDRIKDLVSTSDGIELVGEAGDIKEAIEVIRGTRPDVVTLDLHLPDGSGLELLRALKDGREVPRVIIVTNYPQLRKKSMESGADHFIDKSKEIESLGELLLKAPSHQ
jgi:DNA-binding NarL/FixJ family response regulator